jgi:hypothetical protein
MNEMDKVPGLLDYIASVYVVDLKLSPANMKASGREEQRFWSGGVEHMESPGSQMVPPVH